MSDMQYKIEQNKFIRAWIWFWYNDITRFCVLLGLPIIPIAYGLMLCEFGSEVIKPSLCILYLCNMLWAMHDNDYSNLRRIGLDEYRRKII